MKKNFDYFEHLKQQAAVARSSMETLCHKDIFVLPQNQARLQELSRKHLRLKRELTDAVLADFLPPLDRSDLLTVSQGIYSLSRAAEAACRGSFAPPQGESAQNLLLQCDALSRCIKLLGAVKKSSKELIVQARVIEDLAQKKPPALCAAEFESLAASLEQAAVKNM